MKIQRSPRKNKKYRIIIDDTPIDFGAKGYQIKPGTKAGDEYCARSYGIKNKNDPTKANYWSRQAWSCQADKSVSDKPFFGKFPVP